MVATLSKLTRRDFVRSGLVFGAGAAGLAAGYAAVPDVFARAVYAGKQDKVVNDKVLVMIQLAGGNDGLQTVIPLKDPTYRDLRPQLAKGADAALPISNEFGLNKNLKGVKALWDQNKVAIVQGVGYPKPSFSHFDSIRVWETADPDRRQQDGWLGKTIAQNYDSAGHPLVGCACGTTEIPGALRDLEATLTVVNNQQSFKFAGGDDMDRAMGALYTGTPGIYGALFDTAVTTARDTIAQLKTSQSGYTPKAQYTDNVALVYSSKNQLAAALQLASQLIVTGTGVKILHVTLGGFDTHFTQAARHDDLMGYLDQAISAFYADLAGHGMSDRVLIATWSEFGRRPKENASAGTDHGTAAPVFLIGDGVKAGLYGEQPSLSKLDSGGNMGYAMDFRSVYQEILNTHLEVDSRELFAETYEPLGALKSSTAATKSPDRGDAAPLVSIRVRSRKHRWAERILAFGGLAYWLFASYMGLAFAAALLTSLTALSQYRILTQLLVVIGAFAALAAHRWRPRLARFAHWGIVLAAVATLGTCSELIELPPRYQSVTYRGVAIEFADDGVSRDQPQIRDLIDQVYARSQLPQSDTPIRMRFLHNGSSGTLRVGDWSDALGSGADIVLTTSGGGTRGASFLLEGSFLLAEALARRAQPMARRGPINGYAYWTMLGIAPQPSWAASWLSGATRSRCSTRAAAVLEAGTSGEMTIWYPDSQRALDLDVAPFVDAERSGGASAAARLFAQASGWDAATWSSAVGMHCA